MVTSSRLLSPVALGLILVGVLVSGAVAYLTWHHLALTRGAENLHRHAEKLLAGHPSHRFLSEFRYPDTFILRIRAEAERDLTLRDLDELLAAGSSREEEPGDAGTRVTYDFYSMGLRVYRIQAAFGPEGTILEFSVSTRAKWHPKAVNSRR